MTDETLTRSLDFLTDAAHLLSTKSPEISAHMMTQRNVLMLENNLTQSDIQRQHVCGSCGHIMVQGQGSLLKLETSKAIRARRRTGNARPPEPSRQPIQGVQKVLTCGMCGQYTRINVPPAPRTVRRAKPLLPNAATSHVGVSSSSKTQVTELAAKSSANASSKKRAKSRKQGLQALLQQSQSSSSKGGLGLSFTDFMKK